MYDGPGIRTTIFFRGCNLRCLWCQNPEMQSFTEEVPPEAEYTTEELVEIVLRDKDYYDSTDGGVTLSGGEPLLQDPASLVELLTRFRDEGIHVAVETALHAPWETIRRVASLVDLFLVDFKVVGDEALHEQYTEHDSTLIRANIEKLLDLGATVKFRMVVVPGYNDAEHQLRATADLLKLLGHDTIELLKYHHFYEDKADRLRVDHPALEITPDQSAAALEAAVQTFEELGITAENPDLDATPRHAEFTPRVRQIQQDLRTCGRALCFESSKLKTKYYRKHGFDKPTPIHRAERLAYVLENKQVKVYPQELLVGNFTSKRVAGQVWEEYYGILDITFLFKINFQKPVAFKCSLKDRLAFYARIFPFWFKHCHFKKVYPTFADFLLAIARASEMNAGFNNNMAAIAHFIVNFDRVLELGTTGLIAEAREMQAAHPENDPAFYEGVVIALQALETFAARYADELDALSARETDPERRLELEKMAAICRRVPKHPARTFHEALQSMTFLHVALCIEAYENAVSFGRLDQVLYPYYKADREAGRITYAEAKELLCLFVLKMDEAIFVNDGNSFLNLSKLFETLSTDQAVTFGGVDAEGHDATNDLTYMLIDACELQTLSLDMGARVHEDSPPEYLDRLAEVYINGCPLPQLFSDDTYIETLQRHYPTTLEHARNYAIVGCVEPNASDEHFGNTDCANVNLALPLLQALKGHEHDLWRYEFRDKLLILVTNFVKWVFKGKSRVARFVRRVCDKLRTRRDIKRGIYQYDPPATMDELLARFQTRLNALTNSILADHQLIEQRLREGFTTPLASALFKGCLERGKDAYEGGTEFNSSGIQAVGVTDVADSLHALDEVVFKQRLFTLDQVIRALDTDFQGRAGRRIREALLAVPKFGDDSSPEATEWMNRVLGMYNAALDSVPNCPRGGRYSAGYYALNVANRYGMKTPALPSGRKKGVPLANSLTPHYGMEQTDLLSSLNALTGVDFVEHAENGTTATLTIDSALFQGPAGVKKLANLFKTYLTRGGMQLQPNVINRDVLIDAYNHPAKYPNLLVRIAGYCAYFNELSDEMKRTVINRTCYTFPK